MVLNKSIKSSHAGKLYIVLLEKSKVIIYFIPIHFIHSQFEKKKK